jgi:tryptophanyl-tRNA synthetase
MLDTTTTPTSPPSFGGRQRPDGDLEDRIRSNPAAFRILTGDRPTGPLHVGHYFGSLENRVRLQRLGVELYVLIADYQTITDRDAPIRLADDVEGLVADYLAVGIDPATAVIFKTLVSDALNDHLRPIRARRAELAGERGYLRSVLRDGNERACEIAAKTLDAVHELMHTNY